MKISTKWAFPFMIITQAQPAFCATYKCESQSGFTTYQGYPCNPTYSIKQTRIHGGDKNTSPNNSRSGISKPASGTNNTQRERFALPPKPWEINHECARQQEDNALTPECRKSLESSELHINIRNQRKAQCLEALKQLEAKCGEPRHANKECLNENAYEVLKICE